MLAIGDLHVENYGTWRDAEGRWVWGVNDFDEAFPMAYTIGAWLDLFLCTPGLSCC